MSIRQQIVAELQELLETISPANGYLTDAGARVYVWRKTPLVEAECPCLLLMDTDVVRDLGNAAIGHAANTLTVEIVPAVYGEAGPETARDIEADLIAALAQWPALGGLASSMVVVKSSMLLEQHEQATAVMQMTVNIEYSTPVGEI